MKKEILDVSDITLYEVGKKRRRTNGDFCSRDCRTQVIPNKKHYSRKRDKKNAQRNAVCYWLKGEE